MQYCKQMNKANPLIKNTYKETTFQKVVNAFQEVSSLLTRSLKMKQIKEKSTEKICLEILLNTLFLVINNCNANGQKMNWIALHNIQKNLFMFVVRWILLEL